MSVIINDERDNTIGRNGLNFGSRWDNTKQKYTQSEETKNNKEKYEEYIQ